MRTIIALLLVATLFGCTPTQDATFVYYESRGTGQYREPVSMLGEPSPLAPPPQEVREATGNAVVKLADGTQITAACPVQGLKEGAKVTVQNNGDGTWAVVP